MKLRHRVSTWLFPVLYAPALSLAAAVPGGGGLDPLTRILEEIRAFFEGPLAISVGVIAIVSAGLIYAFTEGGAPLRRMVGVIFGLGIAFSASSFFLPFLGGGAGLVAP